MSTTLTVVCNVNQQECIKRGIGADSTVKFEIDLSTWSDAERAELAEWWSAGKVSCLQICPPDAEGLLAKIRERIAMKTTAREAEERREVEALALAISEIRAGRSCYLSAHLISKLPGDCQALLADMDAAEIERKRAEKAAREAKKAAEEAEAKAKSERLAAQIEAFLATAPGRMAERYRAGLADRSEVLEAIRKSECEKRGVSATDYIHTKDDHELVTSIDDSAFEGLQVFLAKLPQGCDYSIYEYFNTRRGCRLERILVAEATWMVGEVEVFGSCVIEELPNLGDAYDA
jgi:hypothetical protein